MSSTSKDKVIKGELVKRHFKDGQTIMIGGFNKVGAPGSLMKLLYESSVKDLTLICNNCSNAPGNIWEPASKLIKEGRVKKLLISFTRTNTDLLMLYESGEMDIEMIPQGTLAERIRAGAFGLGGILTTVGLNTIIAEGKQVIHVQGKDYLLELPLKADVSLVKASVADYLGNAVCLGTSSNFNTIMAPAGRVTLLEVDRVVPVGVITPGEVHIPGIFVDNVILKNEVE